MLKAQDLRDQSVEELEAEGLELMKEIFQLRSQQNQESRSSQPHLLREKRHDYARIQTILTEKKRQQTQG